MLRKLFLIIIVAGISFCCLQGCRKSKTKSESEQKLSTATVDYEAEANSQIDKENMAQELENIEKELEQDGASE